VTLNRVPRRQKKEKRARPAKDQRHNKPLTRRSLKKGKLKGKGGGACHDGSRKITQTKTKYSGLGATKTGKKTQKTPSRQFLSKLTRRGCSIGENKVPVHTRSGKGRTGDMEEVLLGPKGKNRKNLAISAKEGN